MFIVIPGSRGFSYEAFKESANDTLAPNTDAEVSCTLLGLGDLIVPSTFVVAVADGGVGTIVAGVSVVAISTIIGSVLGLIALRLLFPKGLVAGMIGLVPGTVVGYLVGAVASGISLAAAVGL